MPEIISRQEAKACGLKRYFTGKPCKKGHVAERQVGDSCECMECARLRRPKKPSEIGTCIVCKIDFVLKGRGRGRKKTCSDECSYKMRREWKLAYDKVYLPRWCKNNPDKVREMRRRYTNKHKEYLRKKRVERRLANPDKLKEKWRKYQRENKDKVNANGRKWRATNPEKARARDKKYGIKYREWRRNYRRSEKVKEADKRYQIVGPLKPQGELQWLRKSLALLRTARRVAKKRALDQPLTSNEELAIAEMSSI